MPHHILFMDPDSLPAILAAAFFGGIILNAMPCVFPVLSLKALFLARSAHQNHRHARIDGLAYTAGVVMSFLLIGGLLLVIKASGAVIGWGFQMQSPPFIAGLAYLFFIVGLNLAGFFEISILYGGGHSLVSRNGWLGSFFTGVLATVVATPCTARFPMSTASC